MAPDPGDLRTPEEIDNYTVALTSELQRIAKAATPERRQGAPRNTWWNPEARRAVLLAREAEAIWKRSKCEASHQALVAARKERKKVIGNARRASWRSALHETVNQKKGVWPLAKWARGSAQPSPPPTLPALKRPAPATTPPAESHAEKAKVLGEKFFKTTTADLTDIGDSWEPGVEAPAAGQVTIEQDVAEEEVKRVLREAKKGKAHASTPCRLTS